MKLTTAYYLKQKEIWPEEGHNILAQYTDEYIVVYKAYRDFIGQYTYKNICFGREFS